MQFWLMKSEPSTFGIHDLAQKPNQTDHWEGVRNYQARNFLKDMRLGDQAFFFHSKCAQPSIVGIMEIVKAAYPDDTALNPHSPYFDPKSSTTTPRWYCVDVQLRASFKEVIRLTALRQHPLLGSLRLLQQGSRLSVMPITPNEWAIINQLRSGVI
jgi:predicted RNA-binding protein with PUA-like domain